MDNEIVKKVRDAIDEAIPDRPDPEHIEQAARAAIAAYEAARPQLTITIDGGQKFTVPRSMTHIHMLSARKPGGGGNAPSEAASDAGLYWAKPPQK